MTDPYIAALLAAGVEAHDKKPRQPKTKKPPKQEKAYSPRQGPATNSEGRKVGASRAEKELALLDLKVKTAEVNYQQLLKDVVLRKDTEKIWNRIYRSGSYFADFASRYPEEWAATLGISDPEKIHALKKAVSDAVELFIADFAESVASEIKEK